MTQIARNRNLLEVAMILPGKVKWDSDGKSFQARCPCHKDKNPSLSVGLKYDLEDKVRIVWHCFAGCSQEDVGKALGLWSEPKSNDHAKPNGSRSPSGITPPPGTELKSSHLYKNTNGGSVYVNRFEDSQGRKQIRQHPPGVKGPFLPLKSTAFPPGDKSIVIVEGEKCADYVNQHTSYFATTWIRGGKAWGKTDWSCLKGRKVILWPDRDDAGFKAMQDLAEHLFDDLGCDIWLADIPPSPTNKPDGWDAADCKRGQAQEILDNAKQQTPDKKPAKTDKTIEVVTADKIKPVPVNWLIPGWLAADHITLLAGAPGMGKTTLALAVATAVSTGGKWGSGDRVNFGDTILFTGEDDLASTIIPNLMASGADRSRIHIPQLVEGKKDNKPYKRAFDPASDLDVLTDYMKSVKNPQLVIIDPALALASKARDEYRANDIRKTLEPVQQFAKEHGVAVLCLTHFLKRHNSTGSGVLDRVIGSQAWGAVARMVWAVDDTDAGKALFRAKSNLGPTEGGFSYDIHADDLGKGIKGKYISFGRPVEGNADDAFSGSEREAPKMTEAKQWLVKYFKENPGGMPWDDICKEAKTASDITKTTLRNARSALKSEGLIDTCKAAYSEGGKWIWYPKS